MLLLSRTVHGGGANGVSSQMELFTELSKQLKRNNMLVNINPCLAQQ